MLEKKPTALEAIEQLLKAQGMPQKELDKVMSFYKTMSEGKIKNEKPKTN